MSRKKTARKTANKVSASRTTPNRITRGIKESLLFLFLAVSIFLILSLYSYSPTDPAWSHTVSTPLQQETQNMGGVFGSNFADVSYYLFGYMAYLIPIMFAVIGWLLYKEKNEEDSFHGWNFSLRSFGFILTIVSGCGIATMHFVHPLIVFPSGIGAGGILGQVVALQLQSWFSFVGATLFSLTLFFVGVTLFSHLSWLLLMDSTGKWTVYALGYLFKLVSTGFHTIFSGLSQRSLATDSVLSDKQEKLDVSDTEETIGVEKPTLTEKLVTMGAGVKEKLSDHAGKLATLTTSSEQDISQQNKKIEPVFDKISKHTHSQTALLGLKSGVSGTNQSAEFSQQLNMASGKSTDINPGSDSTPIIEKTAPKKPIKIQTADQPVKNSDRLNKESQKQLFQHDVIDGLPALSLLDAPTPSSNFTSAEELEVLSRRIEAKLSDYNMQVEVVAVQQGPVITRFELQLAPGIKVSQLSNLSKDLARALLVISIRIVEVIAGKSTVGIEIPNEYREIVSFYNVLNSEIYGNSKALLPLGLGADISGQPVVADLAKMPHLLVAGTTGSGKSVGVNSMILSLLFHSNPDELRLIMVDPKMLELSVYEGIPHLLCPVVTDMMEAANALRWCVAEMERRYKLMSALGVRNIAGYNKKVKTASDAGKPIMDPLFEPNPMMASLRPDELDTLPYIVIIIDEFADMMMIVGKKVEELIARLAQKARAAGIHLIIATQRPSVNVITGLIKANIPTRIAFQVSSKIDSRTILDQMGAEALLGNGDMLFLPPGTGMPQRVHGAFVSDEEVHAVVDDLKERGSAEYIDEILSGDGVESIAGIVGESSGNESDPLYDQAVAIVLETRRASISGIQRRLKVGYNRAARMVEDMEAAGLVTTVQSNGQREVVAPAN
ncbi:MAG: DNA translocase FtsK 4TM domain-containing protein [Pseudomonadota bacterium]